MRKERSLIEGNIIVSLTRFAFPVLVALFLQAMYGAVDLLVVGKFGTTGDVSGVATGSMFMQTITMVITGLAMGITILVGESIGKNEPEKSSKIIGNSICLFAVIGVILSVILTVYSNEFTTLFHAPDEAFVQTSIYIKICGAGSLFIIAYNLLGAVFRGLGDSNTPLITVIIACVFNIVGDLVFVAVFNMGAGGAALATVLSQTISVLASLIIIKKKSLPFSLKKKDIGFDKGIIKKILLLGTPVALQEMLVGISFLFIQTIVNNMGINESAGVGVAEKVCQFLMLVGSAYMQAMSAFVAQNIGAGKIQRAKKALWCGIGTALAVGVVMGYLAFFHGDMLARIFDNHTDVIRQGHEYLKAYAVDCVLTPILFCSIGYFNGRGRTLFVMIQGIVGAFCVRVPVVYLISRISGATLFHIGLATPASSFVQIILCIGMYVFVNISDKKKQSDLHI